ncbi:MAG TPA: hypothetical protein VFF31_30395, partial [Blastocatellia bacterium]|nr:hypothetical protein [Blastocatellia bacterium]
AFMQLSIDSCYIHPPVATVPAALPALVFLHGRDQRGSDLRLVQQHGPPKYAGQAAPPPGQVLDRFRIIAPQCPLNRTWNDDGMSAAVAELLKQLSRSQFVDSSRIYLTGWSMGGFGVYRVLQDSDIPAAGAIVSGGCSANSRPLRRAMPPLWVAYGRHDSAVRAARSEELVKQVQAAGGIVEVVPPYNDADGGKPSAHVLACRNAFGNPALYEWLLTHRKAAA